jgi:hypothetical protein
MNPLIPQRLAPSQENLMKKALLFLLTITCFAMPGFAEETTVSVQPTPTLTEAPAMTPIPQAPLLQATALLMPFCGNLCQTPGVCRGCIDDSAGVWKRVLCECVSGSWRCNDCNG